MIELCMQVLSPNKNIKESELEKVYCKYNPVIYQGARTLLVKNCPEKWLK